MVNFKTKVKDVWEKHKRKIIVIGGAAIGATVMAVLVKEKGVPTFVWHKHESSENCLNTIREAFKNNNIEECAIGVELKDNGEYWFATITNFEDVINAEKL